MSTHDQDGGGGLGFFDRTRRRFTRTRDATGCEHPHVRVVDDPASGAPTSVFVCERCGTPLDASDPTLRRRQRLHEARVCVDCGGTYWTTGVRRGV